MIALYLQKHTVYRKRKVFHSQSNNLQDLKPILQKHRKKEKFLLPCSNTSKEQYAALFQDQELDLQFGVMYETVSADLSDLKDVFYDILVFFNLQSIESLYENFPDFKQNYTRLAAFGEPTVQALKSHNLIVDIPAPTPTASSMSAAIEAYIKEVNALQSRE
jgi:uroporphyrinogen-III synthase